MGEVLPEPEDCTSPQDEDCDGVASACTGGGHVWSIRAGDSSSQVPKKVIADRFGTIFMVGHFYGTLSLDGSASPLTSAGNNDGFLARFSADGTAQWSKRFGDGAYQEVRSLAMDGARALLLTGAFVNTIDFGGGSLSSGGSNDVFVAKLDEDGNHIWGNRFGNSSNQYGNDIATDASNNIIITGSFGGTLDFGGEALTSAGGTDIFVAKFNSSGEHLWSSRFGNVANQSGNAVAVDSAGNVYIAGSFGGTVNFGGTTLVSVGMNDIFLAKLDPSGTHLWSARFGDAGEQSGNDVAVDHADSVVVVGGFNGTTDFGGGALASQGGNDIFVAKLSTAGVHDWSRRFGDAAEQTGLGVAADGSDNLVVTGSCAGTFGFGGPMLPGGGRLDAFMTKLTPAGNHFWSQRFGDSADQVGAGVAVDGLGNVIMTGTLAGTVNFGGSLLASAGAEDVFLAKFLP
ncbi:SBBP repeat-containing protein [Sorangium sp. So ce118]